MKALKKYLPLIAAALGLIAVIMIFCPAIAGKETDSSYNGLKAVFGHSEKVLGKKVGVLDFSFMNLLTYVLAIAGIVCSVLAYRNPKNKLMSLIATVCFAVAAIFFFCTIAFTAISDDMLMGGLVKASDVKDGLELGIGAILGGVASILAAVASIAPVVLKK